MSPTVFCGTLVGNATLMQDTSVEIGKVAVICVITFVFADTVKTQACVPNGNRHTLNLICSHFLRACHFDFFIIPDI